MIINTYYLDGLEECNNIDRNWTDHIEDQALRYGRVPDAVWLEKAGMKQFTALFMTIPPYHMERTARAACSKHEKQLTCGAEYEGVETTQGRIEELKTIGNHRMMFEKECSDPKFVSRVYPCVGGDVQQWMQPCADVSLFSKSPIFFLVNCLVSSLLSYFSFFTFSYHKPDWLYIEVCRELKFLQHLSFQQVNSYSAVRESVNARIAHIYDNAIEIIKDLISLIVHSSYRSEDKSSGASVFDHAMSSIARLEGTKCGLFKKLKNCILIYAMILLFSCVSCNTKLYVKLTFVYLVLMTERQIDKKGVWIKKKHNKEGQKIKEVQIVIQMRVCVLRQLLQQCGVEAVKAFNTSISLGYLRTERRERLNLDFKVFNYPVHPNCIGVFTISAINSIRTRLNLRKCYNYIYIYKLCNTAAI
uniref:Eph LBD domain-containing protein n=1 Tax=Heterorhabditis bacteriophora TaxID=37862 RepID=A0A1I7W8M7_HETBA